jgi:hypothetical protein
VETIDQDQNSELLARKEDAITSMLQSLQTATQQGKERKEKKTCTISSYQDERAIVL